MNPPTLKVNQDVFVSYSRRDKVFVQRLCGGLVGFKQTVWIDLEDILPTEEWLQKIFSGIEAANNFIFVISPDSITSNICKQEIAYALENHKRLIPLLYRDIDKAAIPDSLAVRNWIFFRKTDDFDASLQSLIKAINTDPEWVNRHTRLQVRAREWEGKRRSANLVLRSGELREAEAWLTQAPQHGEPQPTPLQIDYIHASRKTAKLRKRVMFATISVIILITSVFGWFGWQQRNRAALEAQVALARRLASDALLVIDQEDTSPKGLLLAVEAIRRARSPETDNAVRQNLLMRWRPFREIMSEQDVQAMAFSPDGKYLSTAHAGGGVNNATRIWEISSGRELIRLAHTSAVYAVIFSPDGKYLSVGGEDGIIKVWDVGKGREVAHFKLRHSVTSVAFSNDNKYLTTSSENEIQVWDINAKQKAPPQVIPSPKGAHTLDGKIAVHHEPHQAPILLETASGHELARLPYSNGVYAVDLSSDGHYLATGSWDTTARIWAINELFGGLRFEEVARLPHGGRLYAVALSSDGTYLATYDSVIRIWVGGSAKEIARLFHNGYGPVDVVALSPDGKLFATGVQNDGMVWIWDLNNSRAISKLQPRGGASALAFNPDSRHLATGDSSGTVQIWDTKNGQEVSQFHQRPYILSLAYSLDGKLLLAYSATSGESTPTQVWSTAGHEEVTRIASYGTLTFSPDGVHLAGRCEEPNACVWRINDFAIVHRLSHENGVCSTAYSSDGKFLATGSWDQTARIWEASSGREITRLSHNSAVNSVAFSPDGRYLATATGYGDNVARVWDTKTSGEVLRLVHGSDVLFVLFSTDGKYLITCTKDNSVRVNLWRPDDLITKACSRLPRNLTKEEWAQHLGGEPYRKTCPDLYASAATAAATLCSPEEQVIFSCGTTKNKVVSLCSSSPLTETDGYLQYRFGIVGQTPELNYPTTREHPKKHFESGTMMYSGGGGAYLKFSNGEYIYTVFTAIGQGWEKEGVVVRKSGKQIAFFQCQGPSQSEIGPALFDKIKIRNDPYEFEFEIPSQGAEP